MGNSRLTDKRPSSAVGKKAVPTCPTNTNEPMKVPRHTSMVMVLWEVTKRNKRA